MCELEKYNHTFFHKGGKVKFLEDRERLKKYSSEN